MIIEEIFNSFKNKTREGVRWKMVGDMYRRMDYIQQTFQGVETIIEFGPFQGCSTSAWLMLKPKKYQKDKESKNISGGRRELFFKVF